jgi:hypothetical protein
MEKSNDMGEKGHRISGLSQSRKIPHKQRIREFRVYIRTSYRSQKLHCVEEYSMIFYVSQIGDGDKVEIVIYLKILFWYPSGMTEEI